MDVVDPMYCGHGRTAAACEACAHADALADAGRAPATRDELYPFPEGGPLTTGFLPEQPSTEPAEQSAPARSRRRS
jgi:hypothetical protein